MGGVVTKGLGKLRVHLQGEVTHDVGLVASTSRDYHVVHGDRGVGDNCYAKVEKYAKEGFAKVGVLLVFEKESKKVCVYIYSVCVCIVGGSQRETVPR